MSEGYLNQKPTVFGDRLRAIPYWKVPYDIHNFTTFFSLVTIHKKERR